MVILTTISALRDYRRSLSGSVGLVPTMGALHEGHASLAREAVAKNDTCIVSIFVNPTQFGPNEDLANYPSTLQADTALLEALGVDAIFAPSAQEIYPAEPAQISFQIKHLDKFLCGVSRPGHMNGVVQVIAILFTLVQPDRAYFGRKDYQQFLILRTMAKELHFPVEVVGMPIIREADGLAMSSRNMYLSAEERTQALVLSRTIREIQNKSAEWQNAEEIENFAIQQIGKAPLATIDYINLLSGRDLTSLQTLNPETSPHIFVSAWLGKARLIDNGPLFLNN